MQGICPQTEGSYIKSREQLRAVKAPRFAAYSDVPDPAQDSRSFTYRRLHQVGCRLANVLQGQCVLACLLCCAILETPAFVTVRKR